MCWRQKMPCAQRMLRLSLVNEPVASFRPSTPGLPISSDGQRVLEPQCARCAPPQSRSDVKRRADSRDPWRGSLARCRTRSPAAIQREGRLVHSPPRWLSADPLRSAQPRVACQCPLRRAERWPPSRPLAPALPADRLSDRTISTVTLDLLDLLSGAAAQS